MLREENIQISLLCDMDGLFITRALTCTFSKRLSDLKQNGTQKRHQVFPQSFMPYHAGSKKHPLPGNSLDWADVF